MRTVLVLGGYGNFGRRVAATLASDRNCRVLIGGRDSLRARTVAAELGALAEPLRVDCHAADFTSTLKRVRPHVLVHTAGPFQAQSYDVPRACIEARVHYVDLADARTYVSDIRSLDSAAKSNDTLVVSGASTLPALSSAVIDAQRRHFSMIESIDIGITSGARPPGQATMEGVLSYAGRPFTQWHGGEWRRVHGWQHIARRRYPRPVGTRWIATCNVPDLELFPERYAAHTVSFRAGVAFGTSTLALWAASWLVRLRAIKSLASFVPQLQRVARAMEPLGSKWSAMHVCVRGLDHASRPHERTWILRAGSDHGPNIPCFPAIALTRKLLCDEIAVRGALPCMGLLTTDEILEVGQGLDLHLDEETS